MMKDRNDSSASVEIYRLLDDDNRRFSLKIEFESIQAIFDETKSQIEIRIIKETIANHV